MNNDNPWGDDKNGIKFQSSGKRLVLGCAFFILIGLLLMSMNESAKNQSADSKSKVGWTTAQKAKICKAYIGRLMLKPSSIISHYRTDEQGLVFVKYKRASDNSTWKQVCDVRINKIVWAAWLKNEERWGRWRNEDAGIIHFYKESYTATITIPELGTIEPIAL